MLLFSIVCALALVASTLSIWDGAFTAAQAERGSSAYQVNCASCHGDDLRGGNGRPLVGDPFYRDWGEDRLSSLLTVIQATMPRTRPGALDEATYADIVAFILRENGFPAGSQPLSTASAREIQVTRQSGPGLVPNFALISVVGCLVHPSSSTWVVERASVPVRTRNPEASQDEERRTADDKALADQRFELMEADIMAAGHDGWRAEVKGLLLRGSPDRINVTSIRRLVERCSGSSQ